MAEENLVWVKVCNVEQVDEKKARGFSVNGQNLVVARCGNEARILQGICSHMYFPLNGSPVENCTLTCSLHRSSFSVENGAVQEWSQFPPVIGPALAAIHQSKALRTYPTRIESGVIYIGWVAPDPESVRVRF